MTETLERDLKTQEQIDNAHDAEFKETLEHLNGREVTQEEIPPVITYEVEKSDGYYRIIKEAIFKKYYPNLYQNCDKKLLDLIKAEIEDDTNIKNSELQEGQQLDIHTENIKKIIDNYLNGRETTQDGMPPVIPYEVKKGDGYHRIIKEAIFKKYYPELYQNYCKELLDLIQTEIENDTGIKNKDLQKGQNLEIHTKNIKEIIDNYLKESGGNTEIQNGGNIETENGEPGVITLTSYEEFKKHKDPFVHRLYLDGGVPGKKYDKTKPGGRIAEKLKKGKKVKIPSYMEKENAKPIEGGIDAITKPDEDFVKELEKKHLDKKLNGKTFILDPGHGFEDIGSMGIINDGQNEDLMVTVFESSIVMDITYRVAKLLRSYGANVVFTHYIPTRGISDRTDLSACVQTADPKDRGFDYAQHQDKWENRDESYPPNGEAAVGYNSVSNRKTISNKYKNSAMFVSFHTNSNGSFATHKQTDVYYKENCTTSKDFSDYLMGPKGIGEFELDSGGNRKNKYTQDSHERTGRMGVLSNKKGYENKNPGVLIEMFNVNNPEQANQYRNPDIRQQKAKQFVDAVINYDKR